MIEYQYLKFLNLQYWYCIVYSIFGGKCTYIDEYEAEMRLNQPPPRETVGFWDWLFGGGIGEYGGPFSGLVNGIAAVFAFVGGIVAVLWAVFSILSYALSAILFLIVVGSFVGLALIRYQELSTYSTLAPRASKAPEVRARWQDFLDRVMSGSPRDWRESIFAADEMLGALLIQLGYPGGTTSERLRAVPEGAFVTLPNAWEAHRIKRFLASASSDYILTEREAFRVMKLYEQVFEEFDFI